MADAAATPTPDEIEAMRKQVADFDAANRAAKLAPLRAMLAADWWSKFRAAVAPLPVALADEPLLAPHVRALNDAAANLDLAVTRMDATAAA